MGGFADTEGEVAGAAAHCADDEPVAAGSCIFVYGAGQVGAFILGGVEAEGRRVVRKRQVVVDRLGDVDVLDRILLGFEELGDAVRGGCGIIAADGDQKLDVVLLEESEVEILLEILVRRFESAHLEIGTSPVEISVRLEEVEIFRARVLAEEAGVSAMEADDTVTVGKERLGYGADHGIHTRGRAAAAKDDDGFFHNK